MFRGGTGQGKATHPALNTREAGQFDSMGDTMGKRRSKRLPSADKRLVLRGPIAMKEGHSTPFHSVMQVAYNLGAGGESMPAWIACSTGTKVVHCYGEEHFNHATGKPMRSHWHEFKDTPSQLQKAFCAGKLAAEKARVAIRNREHMDVLRQVLTELGMPATQANIEWARKLSRQSGGTL